MAKTALQRIKSIAADLHSQRKIPKRYHKDLERGCVILWGKLKSTVGSDAREIKVVSRERHAQRTYSEVQEENCHILLPFMLAISARACEGFVQIREVIAEFSTFRLKLGTRDKDLLNGIAVKNGFHDNLAYIGLIESLFPAGHLQTERRDDSELRESSGVPEEDNDPAHFEISEPAATENISERVASPLQLRKRRHIENEPLPPQLQKRQKEIEYRCSEAPTSQIWLLGERLFEAVQSSHQWKWERNLGGLTTDCLNALVPENRQDISITLVVGHEKGVELIDKFMLRTL